MLEASKKQIKNFANLLRKKLVNDGCHREYVNSLSDGQIMDDFRLCSDCGDEIHSKDQQTHTILEFDSPERAFEILYEEPSLEDRSCFSDEYDDYTEEYTYEKDEDPLETTLRGKYILDGAESLTEALDLLEDFKYHIESLIEDGFELSEPFEDDYGHLRREKK